MRTRIMAVGMFLIICIASACALWLKSDAAAGTGGPEKFSWPNGKKAAVSLTFDDARPSQIDNGMPVFKARKVRATVDHSGWHVYANMEHFNRYLREKGFPHGKGDFPRTDDILSRAINLSVGVVDAGLGAAFGIHIDASDEEIARVATRFREACST